MNRFERPDLYHADCMEALKEFPDQFFDLAIVDPPYGINVGSAAMGVGGGRRATQKQIGGAKPFGKRKTVPEGGFP